MYFAVVEGKEIILYRKSLTTLRGAIQTANGISRIHIPAIRLASGQAIRMRNTTQRTEKSQLVEAMPESNRYTAAVLQWADSRLATLWLVTLTTSSDHVTS